MKLIDMHCDTLWKLMDLDKSGDLMKNGCSVAIPHMKEVGTKAQFFACFTYYKEYENAGGYDKCYEHVHEMIAYLKRQAEEYHSDIAIAKTYADIQKNAEAGKISAVLTVEEGGILNGEMKRLEELYAEGVRLMTLMWNYENCIGYPNSKEIAVMRQGLKPFGVEVVRWMNELGMMIDVSHASDGTFWDVLRYSAKPVVASHSNCRSLCGHPRNLSDEMIRALADVGGIAGLNFYGPFLGSPNASKVDEMAAHVLHMIRVGGSEFPAIGTDFDGFDGMDVLEIPDVSKMERLWDALKKRGISERQLDKIWGGNAERVLMDV
ncbi:dipeptidase [Bariatricus sp. SGI.154]|uniref:dipeptidase n=1 Tax=Bariatricus sp. SGI.154 TaxID=3420549 RepID=UPI003CFFAB64